jgi:hypothetical protein
MGIKGVTSVMVSVMGIRCSHGGVGGGRSRV